MIFTKQTEEIYYNQIKSVDLVEVEEWKPDNKKMRLQYSRKYTPYSGTYFVYKQQLTIDNKLLPTATNKTIIDVDW